MGGWRSDELGNDAPDEESEDEDAGAWELDPNDPTHPDYDLSEAAGYADWEQAPKPWLVRRGLVFLITGLVIIGLILPVLLRLI